MSTQFYGQNVIITGAGKGIGRACVQELTERGAKVVAMARTKSDLDSLSSETGCQLIIVDLLDSTAARAAMQDAGTCDHLINCAGANVLESVLEMTDDG